MLFQERLGKTIVSESYEVYVQLQGNKKRYGQILNEGEHVLLVMRPQFMIPNVLLFMLLGLLFLLPSFVNKNNSSNNSMMLFVIITAATIVLINRWIRMQRYWVLTNQRLFSREGILKCKSCLIDLGCITHISTNGGFLSLLMADGKVFVYTAGHSGVALIIDSQRNPQQTASFVRAAMSPLKRSTSKDNDVLIDYPTESTVSEGQTVPIN